MKTLNPFVIAVFVLFSQSRAFCQTLNKRSFKPTDKDVRKLTLKLKQTLSADSKSMDLALTGLKKFDAASMRYNLICWELSFHYAILEQYDTCFEFLKKGKNEGLFYSLGTVEREYPS